jgi:tritrans,polycis-undecaprenyl-diphosphate synthase [geranylgeranyl-diphosphate specific]
MDKSLSAKQETPSARLQEQPAGQQTSNETPIMSGDDDEVYRDDEELVYNQTTDKVEKIRAFEGGVGRLYDLRLLRQVKQGNIPQHIAVIMDGNRRFTLEMGLIRNAGHKIGKEKVRQVMRWCRDIGVKYLTIYALSVENFNRSSEELEELYKLYTAGFFELAEDEEIHRDQVRCQVVGHLQLMPDTVRQAIATATEATKAYNNMVFTVCLAYGGRQELVAAIRGIARDYADKKLDIDEINEATVSRYLYTNNLPDPDLVIRTSGEVRISNFLLWQMAYAELCFIDVHWPMFRKRDFLRVIRTYQGRQRRYGS